jgi:hypothetical protein
MSEPAVTPPTTVSIKSQVWAKQNFARFMPIRSTFKMSENGACRQSNSTHRGPQIGHVTTGLVHSGHTLFKKLQVHSLL